MDVDRYKCGLCDISYTDANSLAAHTAVAHTQAALNLTMPKVHLKKEIDEVHEKANERNSHTVRADAYILWRLQKVLELKYSKRNPFL